MHALLLSAALVSPVFGGLFDRLNPNSIENQVRNTCATGNLEMTKLQQAHGAPNKDNVRKYLASGGLKRTIIQCAKVATEEGSELRAKQEAFLAYLYSVFVAVERVVDQVGDGSWMATRQNIIEPKPPLSRHHELCNPNNAADFQKYLARNPQVQKLQEIIDAVAGATPLAAFEAKLLQTMAAYEEGARKKSQACLKGKIGETRAIADRGSAALKAKWNGKIKAFIKKNLKCSVKRIVHFDPQPKRNVYKRWMNGRLQPHDYDQGYAVAYTTGEDKSLIYGYQVEIIVDRVKGREYVKFHSRTPMYWVLKKNF